MKLNIFSADNKYDGPVTFDNVDWVGGNSEVFFVSGQLRIASIEYKTSEITAIQIEWLVNQTKTLGLPEFIALLHQFVQSLA
jgi:hypothetical protein